MRSKDFFLTVLILLIPLLGQAQKIVYCNSDKEPIKDKSIAEFYKVILKDSTNKQRVIEQFHLMSGQLIEEVRFIENSVDKKYDGVQKKWYPNGQLKSSVDFLNGKISGNVLTYWDNGQQKRADFFDNGEFKNGKCFNSSGEIIDHFNFVVLPSFPGGDSNQIKYMRNNLRYPPTSAEQGIGGRVLVKFLLCKDGTLKYVRVIQGVASDLDREARRVIKDMPTWIPGMVDGEISDFWFVLPVVYKITRG